MADARKNRLERRFGHPALTAPLFTPMLHQRDIKFLPELYSCVTPLVYNAASTDRANAYSGRTDATSEMLEDQKVPAEVVDVGNNAGGLTFASIDSHNLLYSTGQYLRERDEDEMSLASTSILPQGGRRKSGDVQMDAARRAAYLQRGPGSYAPSYENLNDNVEMSRMPRYGSQEDLLRRHQDPSYADIGYAYPPHGAHSMASYDNSRPPSTYQGSASRPVSQQTFYSSPQEHQQSAFPPQGPSPRMGQRGFQGHQGYQ